MATRYDPQGREAEFEPGSRGRVLRNLLGIKRVRDIRLAESQALSLAQRKAIKMFSHDHRFSAADVCQLHRLWLGPIYAWAGEYRTVNLGKGGFQFASARRFTAGIHAAMGNDYQSLTEMFGRVIDRSRKTASSSSR